MSTNKTAKWIGGKVEEGLFDAYCEICANQGLSPTEGVAEALAEYVIKHRQKGGAFALVEAQAILHRRRLNAMTIIRRLAQGYLADPNEERADELASLCDAMGLDMESTLAEISQRSHITALVDERGSLTEVQHWLLDRMKPGEQYPVAAILEAGRSIGYSKARIERAKAALPIRSTRQSKQWVWSLSEQEDAPTDDDNHSYQDEEDYQTSF